MLRLTDPADIKAVADALHESMGGEAGQSIDDYLRGDDLNQQASTDLLASWLRERRRHVRLFIAALDAWHEAKKP
jgi:hypothetical protein